MRIQKSGRDVVPYLFFLTMVLVGCSEGSRVSDDFIGWLIPVDEIAAGGPGRDGIPAIDRPLFESASIINSVSDDTLVVMVRFGAEIRAYPHDILDYHEIVNDGKPENQPFCVSYCPLTGSAVGWKVNPAQTKSSFGVSGLLYNSNLILYDRETDSRWSQIQQRSVWGDRSGEAAEPIQVVETLFSTLRNMYPDALVMTRDTTYVRNYDLYPYSFYLFHDQVLFPVEPYDERLHPKRRVIGVSAGGVSKVYQLDAFGPDTQTINEQVGNKSVVVVGNSDLNYAVIFERQLADGTILNFSPVQNSLPIIMSDSEGNVWDIFGTAVSGVRAGEQLGMTTSFTSMWFAWAAFFPDPEIHFN